MRLLPSQAARLTGGAPPDPLGARLALLRGLRGPYVSDFTRRVRRLVVVASSSRGGSSMVTELLRHCDALLHLRGEFNPFLRLAGLGFPDSGTGSDELTAEHVHALGEDGRRVLDAELALDAGRPAGAIADDDEFALDAAWRFGIQWPERHIETPRWMATAHDTLHRLRRTPGSPRTALPEPIGFLAAMLRIWGRPVDPWYYDLPRHTLPDLTGCRPPAGPPGTRVVEEPPFVLPQAWRRAREEDIRTKALVVKTPSNAYRMDFLRALFPQARIMVLHLTRNPAAAINGLYDGWRHHGFHAHEMPVPMSIRGYSDDRPLDRCWWKFDLPPGWQDMRDRSLMEVCAFQWRTSHQSVLAHRERLADEDYLRVRFEDLTGDPRMRVAQVLRITRWLAVRPGDALLHAAHTGIPPVVATAPPAPARWRARAQAIRAAVDAVDGTRELAANLGYRTERRWT
ncbi:sulfotransferase [Mangrovihabitans endophyticus]|uniref:sulfotransferase n=1 Tax=Mangrovihabitans endophyticus TaxID=1751298 RepID=UPI001E59BF69|nr:sulfotransferase [Mangrovihabitans endophyticus]